VGLPQRLVPLWAPTYHPGEEGDGWEGSNIISNFRGTWFMNSVHVT
jgi:hypothetical protein